MSTKKREKRRKGEREGVELEGKNVIGKRVLFGVDFVACVRD